MDDTQAGSGAEKSAERLTALSDGIFAIAMTLLVLDVRIAPGLSTDGFRKPSSTCFRTWAPTP